MLKTMRGHDFYTSFRLDSEASAMSSWRSIKQLHNQCVGNLFSQMWADDTDEYDS